MVGSEKRSTRFGGHRGGNILEFFPQEFRPEPSRHFTQHVVQWFFAIKMLRHFEVSKLTNHANQANLRSHRLVCSSLITFGEFASIFARDDKDAKDALKSVEIKVEDIEAETRLLRDNFKMFHDTTINIEEAETILKAAFKE